MDRIISRGSSARQSALILGATALVLSLLGLLTVLASTRVRALEGDALVQWMFEKQCLWVVVATSLAAVFARVDYHRVVAKAPVLLALLWAGLLAVLLVGIDRNGARRWIAFAGVSFQVSEFAKYVVVLTCAWYASRRQDVIESYRRGFVPAAALIGLTVVLVAAEPDFGTSMFLLGTAFILLHLGGVRLSHIVLTGLVAFPPFLLLMLGRYKHILERLSTITDGPHEQVKLALCFLGGGGWHGTGVGEGLAQLWFLPYVESDFIFAALGEQYGFMGTLAVVGLFALFFWHGLKITVRAPDRTGFLVAFGITFMIVFQAGINMAVVTGLVPPKGIGLPFISYGGSSLIALGAGVGTLINVARQAEESATDDASDAELLIAEASREGIEMSQ